MRYIKYENGWVVSEYLVYVRKNASQFPFGAKAFLLNDWHYDIRDSRCPHDSRLEALHVEELSSGKRKGIRSVLITARFLASFHDGAFTITYKGVSSYTLSAASGGLEGHGDWIIDEISLLSGGIRHEILWQSGRSWIIDCADLDYVWLSRPTDHFAMK